MKCKETHCPTCGYDYDDSEFLNNHDLYDSPDPYRNTNDLLNQLNDSKSILTPEFYKSQMDTFYKVMEDNIVAQKYCGECLQPRPEDVVVLLEDGWNIVQKPMTADFNYDTGQLTYHVEQWWLCKKCQENL